ncbi:hypothetical protein [Bacillus rubiinfantis]|uniref:hypothetical protein n=1 Tax=Bacillus rubiinfantis TaxID=1499680 RepID=UPI000A76701A|nr:hypothetical protein [Bacillus rubiinfantis]
MKKFRYLIMICFFVCAFFLQILALLKIFSLWFSIPLLFLSILAPLFFINENKRFKGF